MTKFEFSTIRLRLESELNHLNTSIDISNDIYRNVLREDAVKVILLNKNEIISWITLLKDRIISCDDLQKLLLAKKEYIDMPGLEKIGLQKTEIETIKQDILKLIAKSIQDTYFDSLFKRSAKARNLDYKNSIWF